MITSPFVYMKIIVTLSSFWVVCIVEVVIDTVKIIVVEIICRSVKGR